MILHWIIVAIAFSGETPITSKIFALDPDKFTTIEQCRAELAKLKDAAAAKGTDVWAECMEVTHKPKPMVFKPDRNA